MAVTKGAGEYRPKVPWMQFASHEAPVRYLLRNNLGSGHYGAVRIRHCQTSAILHPATYGPEKSLPLRVLFHVIFVTSFS